MRARAVGACAGRFRLAEALADAWRTLISVNLEDPLRDPHFYLTDPDWRDSYIADLVHDLGPCGPDERACRSRFERRPLAVWHGGVCLAAIAWLVWAAVRARTRALVFDQRLGPVIAFVLAVTVVGEHPAARAFAGLALVMAGLVVVVCIEARRSGGG